jgi:tetratricopeptide (TPR) repeat protein
MTRAVIVAALLVLFPALLSAQELHLKRALPKTAWPGCPVVGKPAPVPDPQRADAERLATAATEASILGDNASALDLLARAAAVDPYSDKIAYRLARTLEALDRPTDAVAEYCRYLAIAPDAADAPEALGRIAALTDPGGLAVPAAALQAFEAAIAHYDAGRLADAEAALSTALEPVPDWGDALYDRGVVRLQLGQEDRAAEDLRRYLELNPGSRDFAGVLEALGSARRATTMYSPSAAFATGLLVPGLGHFTTGRTTRGLIVLGAAAAAVSSGILMHRVHVECLSPPIDRKCPRDQVLRETTERPYLLPALGAAVAVNTLGAIDAMLGAKRRNDHATELFHVGGRDGTGPTASVAPSVEVHRDAASIRLIRFTF